MENKFNTKVVFGSWKAYNECNERALGTKWLDMSDYETVAEIYEEMKRQGFNEEELEETFVQDYEAEVKLLQDETADYCSVNNFFETVELFDSINESDKLLNAVYEEEGWTVYLDNVKNNSFSNYEFWENETLEDVAREYLEEISSDVQDETIKRLIQNYINIEQYIKDYLSDYCDTAYGVLRR